MRRQMGVCLLAVCACGSDPLVLQAPPVDGAGTVIVGFRSEESRQAFVVDVEMAAETAVGFDTSGLDGEVALQAFGFPCSPDAYGLALGVQPLTAPDAFSRMPEPATAFTSGVVSGAQLDWTPAGADADDEVLRSLPIADGALCDFYHPQYGVEAVTLPETEGTVLSMAVLDAVGDLVVSTVEGRFFRVTPTGAQLLTDLSSTTPHLSALRDDEGGVWLFGHDARLARMDAAGTVTVMGDLGLPQEDVDNVQRAHMVQRGFAASRVIEIFDDRGSFYRWSSAGYERVIAPMGPGFSEDLVDTGGMAIADDGLRLLVRPDAWIDEIVSYTPELGLATLLRVDGTNYQEVPIEGLAGDVGDTPTAIASVGETFVVGLSRGGIVMGRPTAWRPFGDSGVRGLVVSLGVIGEDRILIGGDLGSFAQFHPQSGFCDNQVLANIDIGWIFDAARPVLVPRHRFEARTDITITFLRENSQSLRAECRGN